MFFILIIIIDNMTENDKKRKINELTSEEKEPNTSQEHVAQKKAKQAAQTQITLEKSAQKEAAQAAQAAQIAYATQIFKKEKADGLKYMKYIVPEKIFLYIFNKNNSEHFQVEIDTGASNHIKSSAIHLYHIFNYAYNNNIDISDGDFIVYGFSFLENKRLYFKKFELYDELYENTIKNIPLQTQEEVYTSMKKQLETIAIRESNGNVQEEIIKTAQKLMIDEKHANFTFNEIRNFGNFQTKPNYILSKKPKWFVSKENGWTLSELLMPSDYLEILRETPNEYSSILIYEKTGENFDKLLKINYRTFNISFHEFMKKNGFNFIEKIMNHMKTNGDTISIDDERKIINIRSNKKVDNESFETFYKSF